jgi:uncharacterized protein YqjF (DUF2071 family)
MSFLAAEWRKIAIANYEIDASLLKPYLPYKTELDTWNGRHYISLVGFMFLNTRVLGFKIPFHTNFEEVNLRFYVKYKDGDVWKRGVVFVKELVPRHAITFIANHLYKEHYETVKMNHQWEHNNQHLKVLYEWTKKDQRSRFEIIASPASQSIPEKSETEFITEHYWGYTKLKGKKTFEYEVTHPKWQAYPVQSFEIDVDFEQVYGHDFAILNTQEPVSVMLAEGSLITVENKRRI